MAQSKLINQPKELNFNETKRDIFQWPGQSPDPNRAHFPVMKSKLKAGSPANKYKQINTHTQTPAKKHAKQLSENKMPIQSIVLAKTS